MAVAGRVAIKPSGDYNVLTPYERLDLVSYDGGLYLAKKASTGIAPTTGSDTEYWMYCGISNTVVDSALSGTSVNPVQNKVIKAKFDDIEQSFQDGVDTLYDKAVSEGSTPTASTPTAIASAMEDIRSGGDADASDIISGKTAYSGGDLVTGLFTGQSKTVMPSKTDDIILVPDSGKYIDRVFVESIDFLNLVETSDVTDHGNTSSLVQNTDFGLNSYVRTFGHYSGSTGVTWRQRLPFYDYTSDQDYKYKSDYIDFVFKVSHSDGAIGSVDFGLVSDTDVDIRSLNYNGNYSFISASLTGFSSGDTGKISILLNDLTEPATWTQSSAYVWKTINGITFYTNNPSYWRDVAPAYFFTVVTGAKVTLSVYDLHLH